MQEYYLYLSGNVPGGFLLLSFILLSINLALYFLYKSSKLFVKEQYIRNASWFNASIILIYVFLWISLRPPSLPARIAWLPWQDGKATDVTISEYLQMATRDQIDDDYFLHPWEWFYATADPDSITDPVYRDKLAFNLGIEFFVTGEIERTAENIILHARIVDDGDTSNLDLNAKSISLAAEQLLSYLAEESGVLNSFVLPGFSDDQIRLLARAKLAMIKDDNLPALELPDGLGLDFDIVKAAALVSKGHKNRSVKVDSDLKNVTLNPSYQQAQSLLIPYSKEEKDNAELNTILARLYMYMGDYETAEVCIKRAIAQNPFDARVYFLMSFLHATRFSELGFEDRKAVLEYSIRLDPGSAGAIFELADEYYSTGTATPAGYSTLYATGLLKDFSRLNSKNNKILSLLGKIYLQSKFTLEAKVIFERLYRLYPESAENCYNLGIVYYHLKEFDKAEPLFLRAISLNDDDDSYLYLGAIHRTLGHDEKALAYFRERIRRKTGTDDHYAIEAMRQVRIILGLQYRDSLQRDSLKSDLLTKDSLRVNVNENTHSTSQ